MRITSTTYWHMVVARCVIDERPTPRLQREQYRGSPMPRASCCRASSSSCRACGRGRDRVSAVVGPAADQVPRRLDPGLRPATRHPRPAVDRLHRPPPSVRLPRGRDDRTSPNCAPARLAEMAEQAITAVLRIHSHCPRKPLLPGCPNVHPVPHARPAHRPLIPRSIRGEALRDRPDHRAGPAKQQALQLAAPVEPLAHLAVGDRAGPRRQAAEAIVDTPVMPGRLVAPAGWGEVVGPSRTGTLGCA